MRDRRQKYEIRVGDRRFQESLEIRGSLGRKTEGPFFLNKHDGNPEMGSYKEKFS